MTSQNGDFRFLEKCQVGDVTVGGGWVASTSGFLFPVGPKLLDVPLRLLCKCLLPVRWVVENCFNANFHVLDIFWIRCLAVAGLLLPVGQTVQIRKKIWDLSILQGVAAAVKFFGITKKQEAVNCPTLCQSFTVRSIPCRTGFIF